MSDCCVIQGRVPFNDTKMLRHDGMIPPWIVLSQHNELNYYSASLQMEQSTWRHVTPPGQVHRLYCALNRNVLRRSCRKYQLYGLK
jgi:hypothetical protein